MAADVDREKLYAEVWTTPLTTLCKSYGLTHWAMRRLCAELDVPVPPRGHWPRVAAGKTVTKPELPPLPAAKQVSLIKPPTNVRRKPLQPEQIAAESVPPNGPEKPLHRVIRPLLGLYREAEKKALEAKDEFDWEQTHPGKRHRHGRPQLRFFSWEQFCQKGQILLATSSKSVLRVSMGAYKRALRLLSDLAVALEAVGFVVHLTRDNERLEASRGGVAIYVRISERLEPGYHTVINSWNGAPIQERVLSPTGILALYVEGAISSDIRFDDAPSTLLEDQWPRILEGVERQHGTAMRCRARWDEERRVSEEHERLRLIEAKRLLEIQAQEEAEAIRRGELAQEASRWAEAEKIRGYVSKLEAAAAERGVVGNEIEEWLTWAREAADVMDPTLSRLQSLQIKPDDGDV